MNRLEFLHCVRRPAAQLRRRQKRRRSASARWSPRRLPSWQRRLDTRQQAAPSQAGRTAVHDNCQRHLEVGRHRDRQRRCLPHPWDNGSRRWQGRLRLSSNGLRQLRRAEATGGGPPGSVLLRQLCAVPSAKALGAKPGRSSGTGEVARPVKQPGGCAADTPARLPGPLMHKGQLEGRSAGKGVIEPAESGIEPAVSGLLQASMCGTPHEKGSGKPHDGNRGSTENAHGECR